ncbi:MAG: putative oxidoreductase C-terminal domain-containing protein, partial [Bacteroidota bacterium]|nr:putative oxidoreductase C-terminal domain-containing protein [Bacteroidota bacterium]
MKNRKIIFVLINLLLLMSCRQDPSSTNNSNMTTIITVAPGHFHAALVQKYMYPQIDSQFFVFAPEGPELQNYLARIESYNSRTENPTSWNANIYTGKDFFQKMLDQKPGNLVTLAGNNRNKTEYIFKCITNGLNVLSDKPMAIDTSDFSLLKEAFSLAEKNGVLLYDIMTERFEITTIMQKAFSQQEKIFGNLRNGSIKDPAITKESVHHFKKTISGIPLRRPPWFFDVEQEGEAIADVGTHLVDLIQWEAFPEETIDYKKDIEILNASRWATKLTLKQFKSITGIENYPPYLEKYVENDFLKVIANSSVDYKLKGVFAHISVEWKYEAPEDVGDTHFSIMRGTLS